jgi:hypothetical protein
MSEKLTIKDQTAAIDMGARDLWDNFTVDQRKQISFFLLNRYASSIKTSDRETQELAVFKTNEYFNKHFFELSKQHPKLLWYLVCMTGNDQKKIHFHEWIGNKKKNGDTNKIYKFLEELYPEMKSDELELLASITDPKEIRLMAKDMGWDDKEIKKIV